VCTKLSKMTHLT